MPLFTSDLELSDDYPTIEPSLRLDFANARALDPRITFTRASVATYVGRDGLIKTAGVNEARFDHDPTTGESLGLLIEEERTNLITYSEDFSQDWNTVRATISINTTTAPDGTTTADSLIPNSFSSSDGYTRFYHTVSNSTNYSYSIFVKQKDSYFDYVYFNAAYDTQSGTGQQAWFRIDPGNGAVGTTTGGATATIEEYPNGWYRCTINTTSDATGSVPFVVVPVSADSTTSFNGDGSMGVYLWGGQLEVGSFPTSYIPTSGSTVTREKEFPVIETSSIDFSDFSQGGEGTLVCEFSNAGSTGSDVAVCFSGDTHNGATFVGLGTNSNRNAFNRNRVNATNTVLSTDSNFTTTGFYKVAFGIGQSRCTLAVKGSSSGVLEDTSVSYDSTPYTKLILGCDQTSSSSNNMINGTIKSVFYYPTLLTDTQLQTLTQ